MPPIDERGAQRCPLVKNWKGDDIYFVEVTNSSRVPPAYLLGPVAREVRILTWRAIWWILEHIQECANYVYRDERNSGKMSFFSVISSVDKIEERGVKPFETHVQYL